MDLGSDAGKACNVEGLLSSDLMNGRSWPILLKNSIRGFLRVNLEVSNHHLINLRGTERILEGRLFRGL
jgi:hypothetical protein